MTSTERILRKLLLLLAWIVALVALAYLAGALQAIYSGHTAAVVK